MKERKPKTYFVYFKASIVNSFGERPARREISPQMKERKPKTYFVYLEASIVNSRDKRSAPVRDFVPNEATETEDVLCVPRGFGCAQLGQKIHRREK